MNPGDPDWRYADDGTLVDRSAPRDCPRCGMNPSDHGGHDPCIANLPGVLFACCGHGTDRGYVSFENGVVIRGTFDEIKRHTEEETERSREFKRLLEAEAEDDLGAEEPCELYDDDPGLTGEDILENLNEEDSP